MSKIKIASLNRKTILFFLLEIKIFLNKGLKKIFFVQKFKMQIFFYKKAKERKNLKYSKRLRNLKKKKN